MVPGPTGRCGKVSEGEEREKGVIISEQPVANNDDGDAERRRRKGTTQDKQKVRERERRPRVETGK